MRGGRGAGATRPLLAQQLRARSGAAFDENLSVVECRQTEDLCRPEKICIIEYGVQNICAGPISIIQY